MAEVNAELMTFVEGQLAKDPSASSKELFERAKASYPAARELNIREFHARYPLQVKRKASLAAGGGKKRRKRGAGKRGRRASSGATHANRDAVRTALLKFASDLSAAEDRKDLVGVLAQVDTYVDDVLRAANS